MSAKTDGLYPAPKPNFSAGYQKTVLQKLADHPQGYTPDGKIGEIGETRTVLQQMMHEQMVECLRYLESINHADRLIGSSTWFITGRGRERLQKRTEIEK